MARDMNSYYRVAQYMDYGGREWCHLLLGLGDVDARRVMIVNEIYAEKRAKPPRHRPCLPMHERPATQRSGVRTNSRLQADANAAWGEAERLSYLAAYPFKDRHGEWQCVETTDVVGLALRAWCTERGVAYCFGRHVV